MSGRGRYGFTLVEVLVAIGIIGFGLLSLLTLLPVGLRSTRLAGDITFAAFLAERELNEIRARAQVPDRIDVDADGVGEPHEPLERGFDPAPPPPPPPVIPSQRDNDTLGYYDLPYSIEKGQIVDITSPRPELLTSDTFVIQIVTSGVPLGAEATFTVTSLADGLMGAGTVGTRFTATDERISFLLEDNENPFAAPNDEFMAYANTARSDRIYLKVEVINNVWYAFWAARQNHSEDRVLEGRDLAADGLDNDSDGNTDEVDENFIDNRYTDVSAVAGMQTLEDTGLDMVPDYYDANFSNTKELNEPVGETGYAAGVVNDPHGDNGVAGTAGDALTGRGTEKNYAAVTDVPDSFPANEVQLVTVTVVWREGGQTRESRFSTYVANPNPYPYF